jgi:hypothetical protein
MLKGFMGLEIQGAADALLDEPLALRARGAGPDQALIWRARVRDDDERVWRAAAATAPQLARAWAPAKRAMGPIAALASLRPLAIDVRVEASDGRVASRTVVRRLVDPQVRRRRWRDGLAATLHLPPGDAAAATLLIDATAGGPALAAAGLAAPLLASRGVLALVVAPSGATVVDAAGRRLAALAGAREPLVLVADALPVPPGVPAVASADERDAAWDALRGVARAVAGAGLFDGGDEPRTVGVYVRVAGLDEPTARALVAEVAALSRRVGVRFEVQYRERILGHLQRGQPDAPLLLALGDGAQRRDVGAPDRSRRDAGGLRSGGAP